MVAFSVVTAVASGTILSDHDTVRPPIKLADGVKERIEQELIFLEQIRPRMAQVPPIVPSLEKPLQNLAFLEQEAGADEQDQSEDRLYQHPLKEEEEMMSPLHYHHHHHHD